MNPYTQTVPAEPGQLAILIIAIVFTIFFLTAVAIWDKRER